MGQTNSTESSVAASSKSSSSFSSKPTINILVFGKSNVGKSSLINTLTTDDSDDQQNQQSEVGSGAIGCTFETRAVSVMKDGQKFVFYDTAGFNEANEGRVNKIDAICNLIQLLKELKTISLIVYVRKCEVIDEIDEKNYQLIIETLMEQRVPTLCVNTYADNEGDDMNAWWQRNKSIFQKHTTVRFHHGCSVIVGNPKIKALVDTYRQYRQKAAELVWKSIESQISSSEPVKLSEKNSTSSIIRFINKLIGTKLNCQMPRDTEHLNSRLVEQGFSKKEIEKLSGHISSLTFFRKSNKNVAHVVVFGRTNVGKSSLINLLTKSDELKTASNAKGCTDETTKIIHRRANTTYHIYDTAGLNEASGGTIDKIDSICRLIDSFKQIKRINLVVYVRKCEVLSELDDKNIQLIIKVLLQNRVKSLCVNTHADNEEDQMEWWKRNRKHFEAMKIFDNGVSVIVGGGCNNTRSNEDLKRAKKILWDAIDECRSEEPVNISSISWSDFTFELINYFFGTNFDVNKPSSAAGLKFKLINAAGFSENEAEKLSNKINELFNSNQSSKTKLNDVDSSDYDDDSYSD